MTQNETDIIKKAILDSTEAYVEAKLAMSDFVKTQIGVIDSYVKRNGKYYHTVKCDNGRVTYNNVLSIGNIPFPLDSTVFLISPNAQYSNQFILGRLGDTPSSTIGGSINIGNGVFVVESNGNMISLSGDVHGAFDGYIESSSGIINGISYSNNTFFGSPVIKDSTTNYSINIRTDGTKPTITRTYTEGGTTHTDEIAWEHDTSDKQNFISQDSIAPSSGGSDGDLRFKGTDGNGQKKLYRNDDGTWVKIDFIEFGTTDPSGGEDGDIYFQNDGSQITKIWQKVNGSWISFVGGSSGNPPTMRMSNVLGNVSLSITPHITIADARRTLTIYDNGTWGYVPSGTSMSNYSTDFEHDLNTNKCMWWNGNATTQYNGYVWEETTIDGNTVITKSGVHNDANEMSFWYIPLQNPIYGEFTVRIEAKWRQKSTFAPTNISNYFAFGAYYAPDDWAQYDEIGDQLPEANEDFEVFNYTIDAGEYPFSYIVLDAYNGAPQIRKIEIIGGRDSAE